MIFNSGTVFLRYVLDASLRPHSSDRPWWQGRESKWVWSPAALLQKTVKTPPAASSLPAARSKVVFSLSKLWGEACRTQPRSNAGQSSELLMKKREKRGQKGLLSTEAVVFDLERSAEPLARCVFYCLIIIAALLLARIYWSRQAACLLNAYEAETSCSSAVTSLWSSGWFLFPRVELSIPGVCRGDRPVRRSPVCEKSTSSGKEKKHFLMKFKKLDKILIKIFNQIWSQSLNKKKTKRRKEKGFCCVSSPSLLGVLFPDIGFSHLRKKGEFVLPSLRIINRRRSLFLYLAIYLFKGKQTFLLWTSSRLVVLVVSLLSFSSSDISQSESEYLIHPRGDLT